MKTKLIFLLLFILEVASNAASSQNTMQNDSMPSQRAEKWLSKMDFKIGLRTGNDLNSMQEKLLKDLSSNHYYGDPVYESGDFFSVLFDPEIIGGTAKVNYSGSGFEAGIDYNLTKQWKAGFSYSNSPQMTSFGAASKDGYYVDSYIHHTINRRQYSLLATYQLIRNENKKNRKVFSLNLSGGIFLRHVDFKTVIDLRNPNPASNPMPGFTEVSKTFIQKFNLIGEVISIGVDVRLLKHFSFYINENFSFDSGLSPDDVELSNSVITRKFHSSQLKYGLTTTSIGLSYNW